MTDSANGYGWGAWPTSVYRGGDPAWAEYLRNIYYLAGMLYAVGKGDAAIAALGQAAQDRPATEKPA
jgi:hypothetical protein